MAKKYKNTYIKPEEKTKNSEPEQEKVTEERSERNSIELKSPVLDFLNKYQVRMVLGIVSIFIGGFLFIAFVSHIYGTGKADQNIAQNAGILRVLGITPFREYAENWLGIMGAVSAYYFIREWFGYSSFLISFYGIYFGIKRLRLWTGFNISIFKYILFSVVWLSCFLSCILYITTHQWFEFGGGLGKALNIAMIRSIGSVGAVIFWLLILGIFFFFNVEIRKLFASKSSETVSNNTVNVPEIDKPDNNYTKDAEQEKKNGNTINPRMKPSSSEAYNNVIISPVTYKGYHKPSVMVLHSAILGENHFTQTEINTKVIKIIGILESHGLKAVDVQYVVSPSITKLEISFDPSVSLSDILQKQAAIQQTLIDEKARVVVSTNGKDAPMVVQLPNDIHAKINFNNVANTSLFLQGNQILPIAMGISEDNVPFVIDLAKYQHLLFIGTNNQVERNFHGLIMSCLLSKTPQQVKFIFADTQTTEFEQYLPIQWQFFAMLKKADEPIANTPQKTLEILRSLVLEMDNRTKKLHSENCKTIEEYNEKNDDAIPHLILCIYDWESIYKIAGLDLENILYRILQNAHGLGVHIAMSVLPIHYHLIPNSIKKYFPTTILHQVDNTLLSEQIIGQMSAYLLLDDGDTLFCAANHIIRLECPKVYDSEITNINQTIKSQKFEDPSTVYWLPEQSVIHYEVESADTEKIKQNSLLSNSEDTTLTLPEGLYLALVVDAITLIVQTQNCDNLFIQKRMRLTEQRVHKLLNYLEKIKIVSTVQSDGTRFVLIDDEAIMKEKLEKLYSVT
jgi:S-DNA-T family DNA segregation ATPase FtsK/SpoIIIE